MFDQDDNEPSFMQRHRFLVIAGVLVVLVYGGSAAKRYFAPAKPAAPERITVVNFVAPSTPAPLPSATPPPVVEPTATPPPSQFVDHTSNAPIDTGHPPEHPDAPPQIHTTISGANGPDGLLPGSGPDIGGPGSGPFGNGGKFEAFASQVQTRITDALRANPRTRSANLKLTVRIWPDATGLVTRAELTPGTGDASLDGIIRDQILTGMRLDAPPAGMHVPIVMTVTARRP